MSEATLGEIRDALAGLRLEALNGLDRHPDKAPVAFDATVDEDGTFYLWIEVAKKIR